MADKLDQLVARGFITPAQQDAAVMWRNDWKATRSPLRARGFDRHQGGAGKSRREGGAGHYGGGLDMRSVARERYRSACRELGPLREIAFAIVIEERDTEEFGEMIGESGRAVYPMLRRGLGVLVEFYLVDRVDGCAVNEYATVNVV